MTIASQGQPSRKQPSGPLLTHFLQPMQRMRVDFDAAEGWVIVVLDPEHAVFDRTVFDAGGRARAARAALGDDGQFFGFLLAGGGEAF